MRFKKFFTYIILWGIALMLIVGFLAGSEITITYNYNKEKVKEVPKTIWSKTLRVVKYIGELKQAIGR